MNKIFAAVATATILIISFSCQHKAYVPPATQLTGDPGICFESDILPIFISECAKSGCHDANEHEEGYVLDSYEHIIKKGITPGNAIGSKIYQSVMGYTEERMPANAPALSSDKIALLKRWIDAGALKDSNCAAPCDSDNYAFAANIQPLMNKYCTGCHSGNNPQGNITLTSYTAVKNAVQNNNLVNCINYVTGYSGMPKGGLHLSTCQIRQVEKWVTAGMPNN